MSQLYRMTEFIKK